MPLRAVPAADETMRLQRIPSGAADATRPIQRGMPGAADETRPIQYMPPGAADGTQRFQRIQPSAADATRPVQRILPGAEPSSSDLRLFETPDVGNGAHPDDEEPPRGRRRRALVIAAAGAAVAVVAAAGFASGLFTYEKPTRDNAAPEDVRAAVPDASTSAASASAPSGTVSPSAAGAAPSPSESGSPSPSAAESSAPPSSSPSATASTTAPTARATGTIGAENQADDSQETISAPVLRLGDKGDEVTELQLRLGQLYLYNGEANGTFTSDVESALRNYQWSRGIQEDDLGVYGAATRASLESETKEP